MVTWTYPARVDLKEIRDYIAKDSLLYARKVSEEIVEASDTLALFPRRGRIVPELEENNIREIFLYSYRLIYEIVNTDIYILALVHGRRNISPADISREQQ